MNCGGYCDRDYLRYFHGQRSLGIRSIRCHENMNAIFRDDCEANVLTNEAIEVHLSYLRPSVEALGDKLDEVNKKIDQNDKEHIDRVSRSQPSLDGLKWFVSSVAILASGASTAHSLGWI